MIQFKRLGVLACLSSFALSASAYATYPDASKLPCNEVQDLVDASGNVKMTTSSPEYYESFVSDRRYCTDPKMERTESAFIATVDSPSCRVGFRCVSRTEPN